MKKKIFIMALLSLMSCSEKDNVSRIYEVNFINGQKDTLILNGKVNLISNGWSYDPEYLVNNGVVVAKDVKYFKEIKPCKER